MVRMAKPYEGAGNRGPLRARLSAPNRRSVPARRVGRTEPQPLSTSTTRRSPNQPARTNGRIVRGGVWDKRVKGVSYRYLAGCDAIDEPVDVFRSVSHAAPEPDWF